MAQHRRQNSKRKPSRKGSKSSKSSKRIISRKKKSKRRSSSKRKAPPALAKWRKAANEEGFLIAGSFRPLPKKGSVGYKKIMKRYKSK